jgi:hypothetical protein
MSASSLKLYLWLHLAANWSGRHRGTVHTSYADIAKEFGWSVRQVKRTIATLQPRYVKIVQVGNQHRPTIIRILKYDKHLKRAGDNNDTSSSAGDKNGPSSVPSSVPSSTREANETLQNHAPKKAVEGSRSKAATAAPPKIEDPVWNFLGIGPCGPLSFRLLLESRWVSRNGNRPSLVIGETVDAWETAEGAKLRRAPQLFRALSELRQREKREAPPTIETADPIHVFTQEEIPT